MEDIATGCLAVILFVALVTAIIAGAAAITMWAWNIFMVPMFHLQAISYWQGLGLWILIGMIKGIFSVTVNKKE